MKADETFSTPVEVRSEKLSQVQFETPAALRVWVSAQHKFYMKLINSVAGNDPALSQVWQAINPAFHNFLQEIDNANNNPKIIHTHYQKLLDAFAEQFNTGKLFEPASQTGQFLSTLSTTDLNLAARVYAILSGVPFNLQSPHSGKWLQAGAISVGWQRGWLSEMPAIDAGLSALSNTWDGRFSALQEKLRSVETALTKRVAVVDDAGALWQKTLRDLQGQSSDLHKSLAQDTAEAIAGAEKKIADFNSAYNQAIALRAPTQYWKAKQIGHRIAAGWWFAAFSISSAAAVIGVWFVWHMTVDLHFKSDIPPPYTAFIPSIGAGLLATWFMRMFSRQIISNLSLSADAGERVAMVKTYLALTEGGHAKDSDRALILSSLFRSAVKSTDDAAPPTAADFVSKMLRGDK